MSTATDAVVAMNVVGLLAFAVAGTPKGSDAELDPFGVAVGFALARRTGDRVRDRPAFLLADAAGLAAFAATGAAVGVEAGLSPFGVVVTATLTGVGGGSLSDLLLTRVPAVLRGDFYATPAALGGVGLPSAPVTLSCAVGVLALHPLVVRREWRLPSS